MGTVRVLNQEATYLNKVLEEIRDHHIQQDRLRFRTNLEKAGEIMGYEISRDFHYESKNIQTPLGDTNVQVPDEDLVLCSILRAAIPMHNGFLRLFDQADNGFISAYRHHTDEKKFEIRLEYLAAPELQGRTLILLDPMLATGRSMVISYQSLIEENGKPDKVILASLIGSEEGLDHVKSEIPKADIYLAALDNELTAKSFIVPGLGDAGDLAFGQK